MERVAQLSRQYPGEGHRCVLAGLQPALLSTRIYPGCTDRPNEQQGALASLPMAGFSHFGAHGSMAEALREATLKRASEITTPCDTPAEAGC